MTDVDSDKFPNVSEYPEYAHIPESHQTKEISLGPGNEKKYQVFLKDPKTNDIIAIISRLYRLVNYSQTTDGKFDLDKYQKIMDRQSQQRVEERRNWQPFGKPKEVGRVKDFDATHGTENMKSKEDKADEVFLEFTDPSLIRKYYSQHPHLCNKEAVDMILSKSEKVEIDEAIKKPSHVKCRHCDGAHWTTKCPYKDMLGYKSDKGDRDESTTKDRNISHDVNDEQQPMYQDPNNNSSRGRYVPPAMRNQRRDSTASSDSNRGGRGGRGGRDGRDGRSDNGNYGNRSGGWKHDKPKVKGIKLDNIVDYVTDEEVKQLVEQFGRVYSCKVLTRWFGKFAFVNYTRQDIADEAIKKLDGYKFENSILAANWAKY